MSYTKCCNNPNIVTYQINHDPKPIQLPQSLFTCIERLLWYVPDISSKQSNKKDLINKPLYDDFTFDIITKVLGLTTDDTLITDDIDSDIEEYYAKEVCTNCQKVVLKKFNNETKTRCLLRHIRNSIAHGYFNIIGDMLIGFDETTLNGKRSCTAILKLYPENLLIALEKLDSIMVREQLIGYAFSRVGYQVINLPRITSHFRGDFLIKKDGKEAYVEIKDYNGRHIDENAVVLKLQQYRGLVQDTPIVLVIDSSRLTSQAKKHLNNSKIIILDIYSVDTLLSGVDVLKPNW